MANLDGANFKKAHVDVPSTKIEQGDVNGRVRLAYDEYDLDTLGVVIAVNDIIRGPKLPKGARVVNAWIDSPSMGVTGIFDLGHAIVLDENGATLDAADQDAFVSQADAGGQTVLKDIKAAQGLAGYLKKFQGEVQVQAECTEVTVAITGLIRFGVEYVVD